jgi:hypothetical protein
MSDWLDEAERKAKREGFSQGQTERIRVKMDRIKENYEKNKQAYKGFVNNLVNLVSRANNLPPELRPTFGKIEANPKHSKLNNELYIFSSSRRLKQRRSGGFLSFLNPVHLKNVRVLYVSVSKHMDKVDLELKESNLERKRKRLDSKNSLPHDDKDRVDVVFHLPFEKLNDDFARIALDWLAFKADLEELPLDFESAQVF